MAAPLVSIMMPCFNAAETLPFAIASVMAQTVSEWECVCIDDGSTDSTWERLQEAARLDARFVIERFDQNLGRGAARQRCLEKARGQYLAFLDSDDWMFPERLAKQLKWFAADHHIVAVSGCAAVTVGATELVGLMRPPSARPVPVVSSFDEPVPPPLLFPISMVRCDLAKEVGFDAYFRRSQDSDFMIRLLLGRHYALGSEVVYAYSQGSAASLSRTLEGYRYRARSHMRHIRSHPLRVARTLAATTAKYMTYRVAGALGVERRLIDRRWAPADDETRESFAAALEVVQRKVHQLFAA